jgi:hypothetical protein
MRQRVLVCGSRDWWRNDIIRDRLAQLPKGTIILHGCARGADQIADRIARDLGLTVQRFPADWIAYGRGAGIRRNLAMLATKPALVLAFHRNGSPGTQHVIDEAVKRGIPFEVFSA